MPIRIPDHLPARKILEATPVPEKWTPVFKQGQAPWATRGEEA